MAVRAILGLLIGKYRKIIEKCCLTGLIIIMSNPSLRENCIFRYPIRIGRDDQDMVPVDMRLIERKLLLVIWIRSSKDCEWRLTFQDLLHVVDFRSSPIVPRRQSGRIPRVAGDPNHGRRENSRGQ